MRDAPVSDVLYGVLLIVGDAVGAALLVLLLLAVFVAVRWLRRRTRT